MANKKTEILPSDTLYSGLSVIIGQSRSQVATQVNSALTMLLGKLGQRINSEVLQNNHAAYGKQIVSTLSTQLKAQYDRNFELRNLRRMMQFAEEFPDIEKVVTMSRQLLWSHFLVLIPNESPWGRAPRNSFD